MKVEQITITPDESMLFNIKLESKDENQSDQENPCQDMFDYNDDQGLYNTGWFNKQFPPCWLGLR